MKLLSAMVFLMASSLLLAGCDTAGSSPDMQSLQPSKQDQHRAKMSNAIQSTGF